MKSLKLAILLTLLGTIPQAFAQSSTPNTACIPKDKTMAPPVEARTTTVGGNTVETQVWLDWKSANANWETAKDWGCCENLVKDAAGKCIDKSIVDTALQSCTSHSNCSEGKGCLPFSDDYMFENGSGEQEDAFEEQSEKYDPQEIGGFCFVNAQCESYKCDGFTCKANNICRFADTEDSPTPSNVKCNEGLIKNSEGKCVSEFPEFYSMRLSKLIVREKNGGVGSESKCQYELVQSEFDQSKYQKTNEEVVKDVIDLGIITSRGLEWLLGTAAQPRDCMHSINYWKEKIPSLVEKRKKIVAEYNGRFNAIEQTFRKVQAAKLDDHQTKIKTLCGQEEASAHTIAARMSTGKDFLCYMRTRNEAFMIYEDQMLQWNAEFQGIIDLYDMNIGGWSNNGKNWMIGDKALSWENANVCRNYWINLLVGKLTWKKIKKRYQERYTVQSASGAAGVIKSTNVQNYLQAIEPGLVGNLSRNRTYYLLDPLQPGGSQFQNNTTAYGNRRSWRGDGIRNLKGSEFALMKNRYKNVAHNHLKNFYSDTAGVSKAEYIVEPDMRGGYDSRGCQEGGTSQNCAAYQTYLNLVTDVGFAQSMAYSYHTKKNYKDYYQQEGSGRRKLLQRAKTDFLNLNDYYIALKELRSKQNNCIDKYLENLDHSDFDDNHANIEGASNNYFVESSSDYMGINQGPTITKPNVKSPSYSVNKYDLNTSSNILKATGSASSTLSSTKGESANMGSVSNANMAASAKKVDEANKKAAKTHPSYVEEAGKLVTSIGGQNNRGGSSGSSLGSSGRGSTPSMGDLSNSLANSMNNSDSKTGDGKSDADSSTSDGKNGNKSNGANAANAANFNNTMKNMFGSNSSGDSAYTDPTGMSDEEKDVMAANYERNKSKYNPKDDDSLFQVVSKTYMRNLDRMLTRKKKIED